MDISMRMHRIAYVHVGVTHYRLALRAKHHLDMAVLPQLQPGESKSAADLRYYHGCIICSGWWVSYPWCMG